MLKKLFVAAVAAAAMSIPFGGLGLFAGAGTAAAGSWPADPTWPTDPRIGGLTRRAHLTRGTRRSSAGRWVDEAPGLVHRRALPER